MKEGHKMEDKYTKAFKEVYIILNKSSRDEYNKIPKTFVNFIEENMDKEYTPQIDFNENFEETVLEETLLLLALIYRDYLISKEEREILIKNEETQLKELEDSYSVENLFKKRTQEKEENSIDMEQQLLVIKEEKWYKRILNKILNILKR